MTTRTQDDTLIQPSQYRIVKDFRVDGVIYSIGGTVPAMSHEQADSLVGSGYIEKMGSDGQFSRRPELAPRSPDDYLRAQDFAVLYRLRKFRATRETVRAVLKVAENTGRSKILIEALRLKISLPVDS